MKKRVLAFLMLFAMLLSLLASCNQSKEPDNEETTQNDAPSFAVPEGASVYSGEPDTSWYNANDPQTEYTLTTADQFMGFLQLRAQSSGLITFEGVTLKLDCDVVINEGTAQEIIERGESNLPTVSLAATVLFKGVFDGQGHMISGAYITSKSAGYKSLFGSLSGNAVLKDLTVCNSYIAAAPVDGKKVLGGVVTRITGDGADVKLQNVISHVTIAESGHAVDYVGGIVGEVDSSLMLTIENCAFYGDIRVTGNYVGGLIGSIADEKLDLIIKNCKNAGNITASAYVGGLIGYCTIHSMESENCVNEGSISASGYSGNFTGLQSITVDPTNGARAEAPEGSTLLRVMSYNVVLNLNKNKDGTLDQIAQNRVAAVTSEILRYAPDIIGLQEDTGTWHNHLFLEGYNVIADNTPREDVERSSIWYKKGMTLLDSGNVWLTPTGEFGGSALTIEDLFESGGKYQLTAAQIKQIADKNGITLTSSSPDSVLTQTIENDTAGEWDYQLLYKYSRNATYGVFDINGQTVIALNTHLQHRTVGASYSSEAFQVLRNFERQKQFTYILKTIEELKKKYPDALVYMTGDWNDVPFTDIFNAVLDAGFDSAAFLADEKYGVHGSTNHCFGGTKYLGHTYPNEKEGSFGDYLDYIFVEDGLIPLRVFSCLGRSTVTQNDGKEVTLYTSDHLPIVADLAIKTDRSGSFIEQTEDDPTKPSVYSGIPDTSWYTGGKSSYTLTTADQLMGLMKLRSDSRGSITFSGVTVKLGRDMVFNEGTLDEIAARDITQIYLWLALDSSYAFKGTLDGQGHTVSGIYMKMTDSGVKGILGGVSGNAVLKDLTFANCYLEGPDGNKGIAGTLIAKVSGSANVTISNVAVNSLQREGKGTMYYVGGLIGQIEGGSKVTMENCEYTGTIDYQTKGSQLGGLVGAVLKNATLTLKNCTFSGTVNGKTLCGGLLGYLNSGATFTHTGTKITGKLNTSGIKNDYVGLTQ
ncbi:MAG: endonuclease/exonuclease/phosphatase family protein [Clostridia bacterium]|nr:endonuclease/exonuclease/phosphatase family protein [Clostridia bacterium]